MSGRSYIPDREHSTRDSGGVETTPNASCPRPSLTRVQIEALVSGEFVPLQLGPELVHRLNRAWDTAGQHLHMLHVEVVHAPVACPRCGRRALFRKERRGFLQRKVYPFFRLYPWKCISCRQPALLRLRSADQVDTAVLPPYEWEETRKAA